MLHYLLISPALSLRSVYRWIGKIIKTKATNQTVIDSEVVSSLHSVNFTRQAHCGLYLYLT